MKILAIDTTADICSVAICEDAELIAQITVNTGNKHSQTLLPSIEQVLKIAELPLDSIDVYACSTGPGSFTGVRIGVATIKGLAYGRQKPCVSVSSLEALAYNLLGGDGIVCPVINARRGYMYNALFRSFDGGIERLCHDRILSIAELDRELDNKSGVVLCGDGADITSNGLKLTCAKVASEQFKLQNAYSVAICALRKYERCDIVTDSSISPIYLRPSQAERERQERINGYDVGK